MFPPELATGLCSLRPARRSPGAVVRDGRGRPRPRGALRDARRRDPQRRAHDLHRGQRDRHRARCGRACRIRAAGAALRADARAVRGAERAAPPARRHRLRPSRGRGRARTRKARSTPSWPPNATSRTASSKSSCCWPTKPWPATWCAHDVPSLHRVHEAPDVKKVEEFEAFIAPLGYSLAATGHAVRPRAFPAADRPDARHPGGTADRGADAAHDAEGPLRRRQPRTLRPGGRRTTRTSRRRFAAIPTWWCTGCCASHAGAADARRRREELEDALPEVARHTSEMERRADEAERELLQWKKVRFMADKVGDEFDGFVTGVAPYRPVRRAGRALRRGARARDSSMADDFYRFVEQQHVLFGENTKKTYRLGDRVRVQVIRVDLRAPAGRSGAGRRSWTRCGASQGRRQGPVGEDRQAQPVAGAAPRPAGACREETGKRR